LKNPIEVCEEELSKLGGRAFLVPSCTAALELSCLLFIRPGDEVVVPSFCFPSCANSVILRGGVPVFCDVRPDDLNLDLDSVEEAITSRTKAILPILYSGVPIDPEIYSLAERRGLYVIEDAAQAIGNWTLKGDTGCISFHSTKNIECGEGGALIVQDRYFEEVELLRDCGTTKAKFKRGESDGYEWLGVGSSYLISEHQAKYLETQLQGVKEVTEKRRRAWAVYATHIKAPHASRIGNGHIFWFLVDDQRGVITKLREKGLKAASHYEPGHLTPVGRKYGRSVEVCVATDVSRRIVRLNTNVSEEEALVNSQIVNEVLNDFRRIQTQRSQPSQEALGASG
jgi:dTDP-4-amino-4,6-dideoxygalactose transaminase